MTPSLSVTSAGCAAFLEGGPLWRVAPRVLRRVAWIAALGWLPPALLTLVQAWQDPGVGASFAGDVAAHVRSLVAAPLLVLAERVCAPYLEMIAGHFLTSGLVAQADRARFEHAVHTCSRLCHAPAARAAVIALAYAAIAALLLLAPLQALPRWHLSPEGAPFSAAGWWHALVSLPLLLALFLGWLWRVLLWTLFLWRVSRLELRLVPAHPDHAGGLLFVAESMRAYWVLAFAAGAVVAGSVANGVLHAGHTLADYRIDVAAVAIFAVVAFGGPVLILSKVLVRARRRGILKYGAVATALGREFEEKWLNEPVRADALEVQDFSATNDLFATVANVYNMNLVAADLKSVATLAVMALLPFIPVVVLAVPIDVLVERISRLLF
jgi:hypothetical protein